MYSRIHIHKHIDIRKHTDPYKHTYPPCTHAIVSLLFWCPSVTDDNDFLFFIRMEVASLRRDYLPTLSAAKTSKLSLLVKHHILAIDEAS